jgi:hypothetical protein
LLAIQLHGVNQTDRAIAHVERSIEILRNEGDSTGVVLTLTTLGKILTIRFEQNRDPSGLESAIRALEEARRTAVDVGVDVTLSGSPSTELAVAYSLSGDRQS